MADDREILEIFKDEDRRNYAFNLLVRKYSQRLYGHIRKMVNDHDEADDLLQNTLIKAWKYLPDFREDSSLYTWLYRIATNETLNHIRKLKLKCTLSLTDYAQFIDNKINADEYFNGDEILKRLYTAIRKLPPKQMAVFNLKYFEEMKYEQIAEVLGGSIGSLKASYHHAYIKIKDYLEKCD